MKKISSYLLPCILFLFAFRKVSFGIDVTDTGYHFSNFMFMENMDPMWIFSTYLSSYLGYMITHLPGGDTLLGMNIYTSIIPASMAVLSYTFFVRTMKVPKMISFLGSFMALCLCWCPTTCIYNYLTYFVFTVAVVLLYWALITGQNKYLFFAGACLGISVFVRFPNIAQVALIFVVWEASFLKKDTIKKVLQKTCVCILGFLSGMLIVLVHIAIVYGIDEYVQGILRLLAMSSDASGYTLYEMIYGVIGAYIFGVKWFVYLVLATILGSIGFICFKGKYNKIKMLGLGVCYFILFRWFYGQGMFSLDYDGYGSILQWGVFLLIITWIVVITVTLMPCFSYSDKILSGLIAIILMITPLGSNNQLYSNLNNMMLVAPYLLYYCYQFLKVKDKKSNLYSYIPSKIGVVTVLFMATVQITLFGIVFVFRDSLEHGPRTTQITTIPALVGMHTNEIRAKELEELGSFVLEHELQGRKVLLYGDIPALSGYLKMPFVLSPWPDLPSYTEDTFQIELEKLDLLQDEIVFIFSADFNNTLTIKSDNVQNTEDDSMKYDLKAKLLHDIIVSYEYEKVFENASYVIYE